MGKRGGSGWGLPPLAYPLGVVSLDQLTTNLLWKRAPEILKPWLANAQASGLPELVEFARSLVRNKDAVMAALHFKESNGITEGHVNRLKMIERTAYGQVSFQLLRKRVLALV